MARKRVRTKMEHIGKMLHTIKNIASSEVPHDADIKLDTATG
jgi:hypothetical protein